MVLKKTDEEAKLTEYDVEYINKILKCVMPRPPREEDIFFDNETLDRFIKEFIVMLSDIGEDKNIADYVTGDNKLKVEVPVVWK